VLILQGERDANVLSYHAVELAQAAVKAGNHQVRVRIFPNLSHTFTPVSPDKSVSKEQQNRVSADVLETLQRWITSVVMKNEGGARN
jgi:dipeptidyl aminopeptidase/acylaminoacyl peptidase